MFTRREILTAIILSLFLGACSKTDTPEKQEIISDDTAIAQDIEFLKTKGVANNALEGRWKLVSYQDKNGILSLADEKGVITLKMNDGSLAKISATLEFTQGVSVQRANMNIAKNEHEEVTVRAYEFSEDNSKIILTDTNDKISSVNVLSLDQNILKISGPTFDLQVYERMDKR